MIDSEGSPALTRLMRRLENNPRYMSYVLAAYRQQENLTDEELAQELGTLPALVIRLALCKCPLSSSGQFADEVRALADYALIDDAQLASILRRVDSLEQLASLPNTSPLQEATPSGHPLPGFLAATRDRDDSTDDERAQSDEEPESEE